MKKLIAVIPAAGRGSRLGLDTPKALIKPNDKTTLLEIMYTKVLPVVDQLIFVVNPSMPTHKNWPNLVDAEIVIQKEPTGMGDAIFCAAEFIKSTSLLLVIWADQYGISTNTIERAVYEHQLSGNTGKKMTVPLINVKRPYVEYVFTANKIDSIRQSREGEATSESGLTDVGLFILDAGNELVESWYSYVKESKPGEKTNERNFLPFLTWLIGIGWTLNVVEAIPEDRLGINTLNDFEIAKDILKNEDQ